MTGEIFWINNDPNPKHRKEDVELMRSKIEAIQFTAGSGTSIKNVQTISFHVPKGPELEKPYTLVLKRIQTNKFKHEAKLFTADCEVFENEHTCVLYGQWTEYDIIYTWWVIIPKPDIL